MKEMTFKDYSKIANRAINAQGESLMMNAALGLSGECGGVCDIIKKHRYQGHPLNLEKLMEEVGDVLWYLNAMCESFGYTLAQVAKANNDKLTKRFPDGFTVADSLERRDTHAEHDLSE